LGKFWRALEWNMLIYFLAVWNILQTFGILYDHLIRFVFIWYIFSAFGIMYRGKSGNPDCVLNGCSGRRRKQEIKWVSP
jgi:hypothetical protein